MFSASRSGSKLSADAWSTVQINEKQKLFKIHHFLFMSSGRTYNIEIQESPNGDFLAHAENTADPHDAIKSVHARTLEDCLQSMVNQLGNRQKP